MSTISLNHSPVKSNSRNRFELRLPTDLDTKESHSLQALISPRAAKSLKSPQHRRPRQKLKPLQRQDCDSRWDDLQRCLSDVKGLSFQDTEIVAISTLDGKALDPIGKAIQILVDAGHLVAACTLIGMCKPVALLDLLGRCSHEHISELISSNTATVRETMNEAFSKAAESALRQRDFPRFFTLLQSCSCETRSRLGKKLLPVTKDMFEHLDDHTFIEAMRIARKQISTLPTNARLNELHSLLTIAGELAGQDPAKAMLMKCIIWPVLAKNQRGHVEEFAKLRTLAGIPELTKELLNLLPQSMQGKVLRVAADQLARALNEHEHAFPTQRNALSSMVALPASLANIEQAKIQLKRLLAWLSPRVNPELARELGFHVANAWKDRHFADEPLKDGSAAEEEIETVKQQALQASQTAQNFRQAMKARNLIQAASLIRHLPDPTFRAEASGLLFKAIGNKLWGVGIDPQMLQKINQTDDEASRRQASVVAEVYTLLTMTGEPNHKKMAARILALVEPELLIQLQLEKLKPGGSDLRGQMAAGLPTLCHGDHFSELAIILELDLGKRLAAQAAIDYLSVGNSATVTLLFTTLAHRIGIDLRAALSPPSTLETPRASQQSIWNRLKARMKGIKFDEAQLAEWTPHLDQWLSGWRLLLSMSLAPDFFDRSDPNLRPAVIAIDAAAAGAKSGAAIEVGLLAEDGSSYDALAALLNVSVVDLFPNDALGKVISPLVSDKKRAERTFEWIKEPQRPQDQRVRLYAAIARELVSLLPVGSPYGLDEQPPANTAAAYAASLLRDQLVGQQEVAEAVQSRIDRDEWKQLWILAAAKAQH